MSEVPAFVNTIFDAMRKGRESVRNSELRGKRYAQVRALVNELSKEGVEISDDALEVLKDCIKGPRGSDEGIDLLCPEPDKNVGVVDFKQVWETVARQKAEFVKPRDMAACLKKYRDKLTPADFSVMFTDNPSRVCQLFFLAEYEGRPWVLVLGMPPHGGLYLEAEPLSRSLVAGSMFPIRRPC